MHDRRVLKRYNIFVGVEFRQLKESAEFIFGITNNFTCEGFNFESRDHGIESGQNIEFIFRHPKSDLSVNAMGSIAWIEKQSDSKCLTGVKFIDIDKATVSKVLEIVSASEDIPVEVFYSEQNDKGILQVTRAKDAESEFNNVQEKQLVKETPIKDGTDVSSNVLSLEENTAIWEGVAAMREEIEKCKQKEEGEGENMEHDHPSDFNDREIEDKSKQITANRGTYAGDSIIRKNKKRRVLLFIPGIVVVLVAIIFSWSENITNTFRTLFPAATELTFPQEADSEKPGLILDDAETRDVTEEEPLHTKQIQTQEKSNILPEEKITEEYPVIVPVNKDKEEYPVIVPVNRDEEEYPVIVPINKDADISLFPAITESTFPQEADGEKPALITDDAEPRDLTEKEPLHTKQIQTQEKSNILPEEKKTEEYPVIVPENKNTEGDSNYFIQIGSWKNIEYAQEMLTKLKKDYPETYIVKITDFHKIRIPNILNKKQGDIISIDIEKRFSIKPLLVTKIK